MKQIKFILFLSLIIMMSCQQNDPLSENMIQLKIDENWQLKETGSSEWLPATVPGTVHTDLLSNGIIEDPYYRTNEKDLQWIDKNDWEYRSTFLVEDELLRKKEIRLLFEGLDTYATVFLNGVEVLEADNMFRSWEISCKEYLKVGENEIHIILHSPINIGLEKLQINGYPLPASNDQSENGELGDKKVSIFTRKAGYHFGWDWGPRLVTSGIWRPIRLVAFDYAKIENIHILQNKLTDNKALMDVSLELESETDNNFDISLYVNGKKRANKKQAVFEGKNQLSLAFEIDNPKLWWPNGMGDQQLYDIEVRIEKNGETSVDSKQLKIGIRTVELVQDQDTDGRSFYFKINGQPVFAKGANYIPNDVFLPRFSENDYERIIKDAADANMNMLRVWGGGIYENDIFYNLCDKYGIMVWQDFMYACSMYPGDDEFLNNARIEAEENIIRLRNHPSLVLWCGNNEIEVAWGEYEEGRGWGWKERYSDEERQDIWHDYDTLFHHILPEAVQLYNPQITYWHSSPSAGMGKLAGHENTSGDMHYWGVWHGQHPFNDFRKYRARFMSEYGFQSFPELNTVKTYALPEEWDIESDVMAAHQRSGIGNLRIKQYMEDDYIIPEDFETFLYTSQLLQAEAIKMAIESHRADMPYCMGTLYWQLNDCWPVASWSGIDYQGRWKAMHYFVKKAYQETIIASFQDESKIELWAVSDHPKNQETHIKMQLIDFDGNLLWEELASFELHATSSKMFKQIPLEMIREMGSTTETFLHTEFYVEDNLICDDVHYFEKVKNLQLKTSNPEIQIDVKDGFMDISLTAHKLTKNIFLSTDLTTDHFSDNFFDLLPGETKHITFPGNYDVDEFLGPLNVLFLSN